MQKLPGKTGYLHTNKAVDCLNIRLELFHEIPNPSFVMKNYLEVNYFLNSKTLSIVHDVFR